MRRRAVGRADERRADHPPAADPDERGAAAALRALGHPQRGHAARRCARVTDALDAERIAVREALGYGAPHFPLADHYDNDRWMYGDAHKQLVDSRRLARAASTCTRTATCARTRRYGLAFLVSVARWAGVDAPVAHGLLALAGAILGRDLRDGPRTLDALGPGRPERARSCRRCCTHGSAPHDGSASPRRRRPHGARHRHRVRLRRPRASTLIDLKARSADGRARLRPRRGPRCEAACSCWRSWARCRPMQWQRIARAHPLRAATRAPSRAGARPTSSSKACPRCWTPSARRSRASAPRRRADAIIASTTSTILVTDLAPLVTHPERLLNAHWLNPAYVIPLVELSAHAGTAPAVRRAPERAAARHRQGAGGVRPGARLHRAAPAGADHERGRAHGRGGRGHAPRTSTRPRATAWACASRRWAWSSSSTSAATTSCTTRAATCRTLERRALHRAGHRRPMMAEGRNGLKSGQGFYDYRGIDVDCLSSGRAAAHAGHAAARRPVQTPRHRLTPSTTEQHTMNKTHLDRPRLRPRPCCHRRQRRPRPGGHAQGGERLPGRHLLRARLREVRQEGQRRGQGPRTDQLHRRPEGHTHLRAAERAAQRRGRHGQHHLVLHRRAGARRPGAELHRHDAGRDAQERHLRPDQRQLCRQGPVLLRAHRRGRAVLHLQHQEDRQGRPDAG